MRSYLQKSARKDIGELISYKPGKPAQELARELGLRNVIKLASNENPFGPSKKVRSVLRKAISQINRYPLNDCFYLRAKLSDTLGVSPYSLMFGNGSDEIIVLVLKAFLNPGEKVVVAHPTFLMYGIASRYYRAKVSQVPMKDFKYDLKSMLDEVDEDTKIVFIANPDNPTGSYVSRDELEDFLDKLPEGVIAYLDEAYLEYVDARNFPDSLRLLEKHPNLIISRTFSKAYGLAGLRIGYGIADSELITLISRIQEPFSVNSLAQIAAETALDDKKYLNFVTSTTRKEKEFLRKNFSSMGFEVLPSQTNFLTVKIGSYAPELEKKLLRSGFIVRNMKSWGMSDFLRVTVGIPKENRKLIKALRKNLKT